MQGTKLQSGQTRNVAQYRTHHAKHATYGQSSGRYLFDLYIITRVLLLRTRARPLLILDFGCGKSTIADNLGRLFGSRVEVHKYDPAIPGLTELTTPRADLVINTDVLEHLDEHETDLLINDLFALSPNCFINIATRTARAQLANGENAHATVRPAAWWLEKLNPKMAAHWVLTCNKRELTLISLRPPLWARLAIRSRAYRRMRTNMLKKRLARS